MHFRVLLPTRAQADDSIPGSALPIELQWEYRQWLQTWKEGPRHSNGEEIKALEDAPASNQVSKRPSPTMPLLPDDNCSAAAQKAADRVRIEHSQPKSQRATYISGTLPPTRRRVPQGTKIKKVHRPRSKSCPSSGSLPAICDAPQKLVRFAGDTSALPSFEALLSSTLQKEQAQLHQHALSMTRLSNTKPRRPKWEADECAPDKRQFDAHQCPRRVRKLIGNLRDLRSQMHDITRSLEHVIITEKFKQEQVEEREAESNLAGGLLKMYERSQNSDGRQTEDMSSDDEETRPLPSATKKTQKQARVLMCALRL